MKRVGEKCLAPRLFNDMPRVHHRNVIGHARHHAEVMGDQQDGHSRIFLQLLQQLQDLGLDGDIQGGSGFIGDEQLRLARQGNGDHHPLLHAAGKLMGIFIVTARPIRDPHRIQQFQHPLAHLASPQTAMPPQHFSDLLTHREHRIQ